MIPFHLYLQINIKMPIILNEEEDSVKYNLLNQSLRDDINFRPLQQQRYSNQKNSFYRSKYSPKSVHEQLTDWNDNAIKDQNDKRKSDPFILPKMKLNRKSKNIEDLSRQLLKYEQFNSDENNQAHFRLTILKQMTKINFIKQKPKKIESPKKINLKLQFPQRYQSYQQESQQKQFQSSARKDIEKQEGDIMKGSFYARRSSHRGLIPSIKKLSSFPKKSMFRSQSQRDPYQNKKLMLNKDHWEIVKKNVTDQLQEKITSQNQNEQSQNIFKLVPLQKRLPLNFLSYSHRKQSVQKQENDKDSPKKTKKSPYLVNMSKSSYRSKFEGSDLQNYSHQRLSECMFLSISKKKYANK